MTSIQEDDRDTFVALAQVRSALLESWQRTRDLSQERHRIMQRLLDRGYSYSDLARELGVSRQAVRKMFSSSS